MKTQKTSTERGIDTGCFLWWVESGKGEGKIQMGEYATADEAERAIPAANDELLSQCGDKEDRDAIRAGVWHIEMSDLTAGRQAYWQP
jgi:hypothetical protein